MPKNNLVRIKYKINYLYNNISMRKLNINKKFYKFIIYFIFFINIHFINIL